MEVARELREFDCGQYFLDLDKTVSQRFAEDLLAIRLRLSGYSGTPDTLIGPSEYSKGSLGEALRARREERGQGKTASTMD